MRPNTLRLLLLTLIAGTANAAEFSEVQTAQSKVAFDYKQMSVPLSGSFAKFAIQARFDPAKLATSQAKIDIDIASIDTGNSDADDEVTDKLWFDTQKYPTASFVASSFKALGGDRYQAQGKLSLKGKTVDITAPFTFKQNGNSGIFDGSLNMNRLDYGIGTGIWADVATVANEVSITFHFVASSKK